MSVRASRIALLIGSVTVLLACAYLWDTANNVPAWGNLPRFAVSTTPRVTLPPFFPAEEAHDATLWMDRNMRTMHALMTCSATESCRSNQTKVVLLGSFHLVDTIKGHLQGEHVWGRSILTALDELGYSYLFSQTNQEVVQQYRMLKNLVVAIILEPDAIKDCFKDALCLKSSANPSGLPFWLLFGFHWWPGDGGHPLGQRWTLSPERYDNDEIYIGYSIEDACSKRSFVPFAQRSDQAYILAKYAKYFSEDVSPWTKAALDMAAESTNVTFVVGLRDSADTVGTDLPLATRNLGSLNQDQFFAAVSRSKVLIGVGNPMMSPSPWDALCLGVPFINPALWYDPAVPHDSSKWSSQHDPVMQLGEPYAYTVLKGDVDGFSRALQTALSTPIQSYVHPGMTKAAVRKRVAAFLSTDWRVLGAEELLNRTLTGRELYVL